MQVTNSYEPHVDGLRAVAVLSVLFFHLNLSLFSGGFVGVDVFFVISGFLITRMIVVGCLEGTFSLYNFYIRRIQRVFPALFVVVLVSAFVAYCLFPPNYFVDVAQSAVYSLVGVSNVYFWSQAGYFDSEATMKPLLHIWSLGVEEQFYVFWSILLVVLFRYMKAMAIVLPVVVIGLVSLLLSIMSPELNLNQDDKIGADVSSGFYLVPFRVFEFAIGGLIVWVACRFELRQRLVKEGLTLLGLALIMFAVFTFDKNTPFPSYNALLPCIGAFLVIYCGSETTVGKLLTNRIAIYLGLISYSIYLFHWPLYVFFKFYLGRELDGVEQVLMVIVTLALSALSYRFIEQYFRKAGDDKFREKVVLNFALLALLSVTVIFSHFQFNQSDKKFNHDRLNAQEWAAYTPEDQFFIRNVAFHDYVWHQLLHLEKPFYDSNSKNIWVIGDSMAGDFTNMLLAADMENREVRTSPIRFGCSAIIHVPDDFSFPKNINKDKCMKQYDALVNHVNLLNADVIVLASSWREWSIAGLRSSIDFLAANSQAKIYVVGNKDMSEAGLSLYAAEASRVLNTVNESTLTKTVNAKLSQVVNESRAEYLRLQDYYCEQTHCPLYNDQGYIYIYDRSHLTPKGAQTLGRRLFTHERLF